MHGVNRRKTVWALCVFEVHSSEVSQSKPKLQTPSFQPKPVTLMHVWNEFISFCLMFLQLEYNALCEALGLEKLSSRFLVLKAGTQEDYHYHFIFQ